MWLYAVCSAAFVIVFLQKQWCSEGWEMEEKNEPKKEKQGG